MQDKNNQHGHKKAAVPQQGDNGFDVVSATGFEPVTQ